MHPGELKILVTGTDQTFEVIHLLQAFFKCDFRTTCVVVDKITTDIARRALPLRQLSFL